jgi:pterin-4a-carbinolamine dehydratase
VDLTQYDNYILTNDSIYIIQPLIEFKNLFYPFVEMTSLVSSNEYAFHYPDFLRRYNQHGIHKLIKFYKENLKEQPIFKLIEDIELKCHMIHDSINVLYPAENGYYHNIHFDNLMLKKYIDNKYPILKIKKLMEFNYVSYPLFLLDYNKQLDINFDIYNLSRSFHFKSYISSYSDFNNGYRTVEQSVHHWINYGKMEGRTYFFNWIKYLNTYPDLRQNGILTEQQSLQHWLLYGKKEGRIYFS